MNVNKKFCIFLTMMMVLIVSTVIFAQKPGEFAGTTITVLGGDHPGFNALREIIPDFEKKYGIKVRIDQVDYQSVYNKVMLSGDKPDYDVVMVDVQYVTEYVLKNRIAPLEPYINDKALLDPNFNLQDIVPAYLNLFTVNNKLYGFPLSGETALYFYRKDIYNKHGLKPAEDLDTLLEQIKYIHDKEAKNGVYGASWRTKATAYSLILLMWAHGGGFFVDDDPHKEPIIDSAENLEAFRFFAEAVKYTPPGGTAFDYNEAAAAFQQLKAAVFIDASNCQFFLNPLYSRLTLDTLGWAQVPFKKGAERKTPVAGWSLAITSGSQNKRAAFKFLEYQVLKENDKRLLAAGRMPNLISTHLDEEMIKKYPFLPAVWEALKYGHADWRPRIPEWAEMYSILMIYTTELAAGIKTPEEVAKAYQQDVKRILGNAGYYK